MAAIIHRGDAEPASTPAPAHRVVEDEQAANVHVYARPVGRSKRAQGKPGGFRTFGRRTHAESIREFSRTSNPNYAGLTNKRAGHLGSRLVLEQSGNSWRRHRPLPHG